MELTGEVTNVGGAPARGQSLGIQIFGSNSVLRLCGEILSAGDRI